MEISDKPWLNPDDILSQHPEWRNMETLPSLPSENTARNPSGRKPEDPREKSGIVGAFCRAYTVDNAISEFLPDVYEPAGSGRYSYREADSKAGLVVYDGLWAYSNHATDPDGGPNPFSAMAAQDASQEPPRQAPCMEGYENPYSFYTGRSTSDVGMALYDDTVVDGVLNFLDGYTGEKPLFIYCTLMNPHPPYLCDEELYQAVDAAKIPSRRPDVETLSGKPLMMHKLRERLGVKDWGEEQWDELRHVYLGMVGHFDRQLGRLVEKLRERGIYDDTSLFVFSDHGDYTGDYGLICRSVRDAVFEPARRCLVPHLAEAEAAALDAGAGASFLGGSGPCVISFFKVSDGNGDDIAAAVRDVYSKHGMRCDTWVTAWGSGCRRI